MGIGFCVYYFVNPELSFEPGTNSKEMIEFYKLDDRENDMGFTEKYYDGKPFTGYAILEKITLESSSELFWVKEYSKGAFIIDQFKYVNEQGEEKQPNPKKIINRESFLEKKTNKLDNNENELETEKNYVKEDNFSNLNEQITSLKNADEKDKDSHHLMGYINVDNLNFRSSPDFSNNIIKKLKYGTSLKVIEIIKSEILEVTSNCLLKNNFEIKHNQNIIVFKRTQNL